MSDLSDLFARDPLSLTREDITKIVERYRAARAQFAQGVKAAGATKTIAPKAKKEKMNLDDLDL